MKHPLLATLGAGALALALPAQMLAAYLSPSSLFWAWTASLQPKDVAGEFHVQLPKEQVFLSAWMKGTQEGGMSMKADGKSDITIDIVAPKENINARMKLSMVAVDGTIYLKVSSISGSMDEDIASFSAEFVGKKWIMLPSEMTADGADDPFEALSMHLSSADMEMSAADLRQLIGKIMDASFSIQATKVTGGTEYLLTLKRGFATNVRNIVAQYLYDLPTVPDQFGSETELKKIEREILRQTKIEMKVRTDAQDKPVSMTATMSVAPAGGDLKLTGKISAVPHAGAFSVAAPAGAISLEELMDEADAFGGFDGFEPSPARPSTPPRALPRSDAPSWEFDPCDGMNAIERIAAIKKGLCGDERTNRPRR